MAERYLDTVEDPGSSPGASTIHPSDPEYPFKEVNPTNIISILDDCLWPDPARALSFFTGSELPNRYIHAQPGDVYVCNTDPSTVWVCTGAPNRWEQVVNEGA